MTQRAYFPGYKSLFVGRSANGEFSCGTFAENRIFVKCGIVYTLDGSDIGNGVDAVFNFGLLWFYLRKNHLD